MNLFSANPLEIIFSLNRNNSLIYSLIYRDVLGRYKGSMLGVVWSLINPILMLAIYTFVFSFVFKARWNSEISSGLEFSLVLFAGLMIFNLFSECVLRAPSLITSNVNYVKKVIFPLEILPIVNLGSALFHFFVSLCVWITGYVILIGLPYLQVLFLPLVLIPFCLFIMGLSWSLAALGVYLRDIGQVIGIAVTMLMFLSPIFYPASALPQSFQFIMHLNPLTIPIEMVRDLLYFGVLPSLQLFTIYTLGSIAFFILGFALFQKFRKGFSDVL